jgi:hypothetical protein
MDHIKTAEDQLHSAGMSLNAAKADARANGNELLHILLTQALEDALALRDRMSQINRAVKAAQPQTQ